MIDRRFDMMDFEQSLKDHADQFRLVPSKRIWNGIYNNLHPGSKWPSMTMAIIIILTLISIGYLNNSSSRLASKEVPTPTMERAGSNFSEPNIPITNGTNSILENSTSSENREYLYLFDHVDSDQRNQNAGLFLKNGVNQKSNIETGSQASSNRPLRSANNLNLSNVNLRSNRTNGLVQDEISTDNASRIDLYFNNMPVERNEISSGDVNLFGKQIDVISINKAPVIPGYAEYEYELAPVSMVNKIYFALPFLMNSASPIDTYIQQPKKTFPKKVHIKRNKNIEWTYYITPTISNARFGGSASSSSTINYSPLVIFQRSNSNGMIYNAKLGFETGAKMTYKLSKNWKFVTGFNINYSDYNIVSNPIHPTFSTLMLKDESTGGLYPKDYITFYGDGQSSNPTGLTNYSLQFSIPVGLEYQVWGNEKMQINIASAVEPSLVLKSHSYIISADKRYYVEDPDLMRKMNLRGNLGAFISFGSNKIKWHIGPDIHYQLFSTYKSEYPAQEHLINYGIRIGVSKKY